MDGEDFEIIHNLPKGAFLQTHKSPKGGRPGGVDDHRCGQVDSTIPGPACFLQVASGPQADPGVSPSGPSKGGPEWPHTQWWLHPEHQGLWLPGTRYHLGQDAG